MARVDALFGAIEAVHTAGLDADRWPAAIERMARVTGSCAATLEVYDLDARRHRAFHEWGVDPTLLEEYLQLFTGQLYVRRNEVGARRRRFPAGHLLDRSGQEREPFYSDYLGDLDLSGFAAGILNEAPSTQAVLTMRRNPAGGSAGGDYLEMFQALASHVGLALKTNAELRRSRGQARALAEALDLLDIGAALVRADGAVTHANAALRTLTEGQDGVSAGGGGLRFAGLEARRRYGAALDAVSALRDRRGLDGPVAFQAARPSGAPRLTVAVRPLFTDPSDTPPEAAAVVFVHDPLARLTRTSGAELRRPPFNLTIAESHLAVALMQGTSPVDYARAQGVSINTAYTHLRRLKDKTGARRLPELIHRLNEATPSPAFAGQIPTTN
ncbi:helix-turn-helix transcriptional regulator [uncultured Brevundimonas sp.]|uniref:helix-turn-helix transcriptional regulator n=1 Tax=uncultured Brevundimonas sp. TaxID=213418 RepID=UPI002618E798|nr:helix-turn-helix transcriptional regulator [uncultured Brevundimonas sp.]